MKKSTGFFIGILLIFVVIPAPVFSGSFSDPAVDILDQELHALAPVPLVTATPKTTLIKNAYMVVSTTQTPLSGGLLNVGSTPSGASVYIDGSLKGTTPLSVSPVSVGIHAVTFKKAGYADYSTKVTVTAGGVAKVFGSLTPVTTEMVTSMASPSETVTLPGPGIMRPSSSSTPVPVTVRQTLQPVAVKQTGRCMRQYFGSGRIAVSPEGRLNCTMLISTDDKIASLTVQEGTLVMDGAKQPVTEIRIRPVTSGEID